MPLIAGTARGCLVLAVSLHAPQPSHPRPTSAGVRGERARDSVAIVAVARAALERRAGRLKRRVVSFERDSAGTVVGFLPDCPSGRLPRVVCSDGGGRVRVRRDGRPVVLSTR